MAIEHISIENCTIDQKTALEKIKFWFNKSSEQEFRLGGLAGTGKTSLMKMVPSYIGCNNVNYGAFTGKAAKVLRSKGISFASTIHSMIYDTEVTLNEETGLLEHSYKLKHTIDPDLIIIDEASMVGKDIYKDLMSFGRKVLYVGDHGQLPPIENSFNLMNEPTLDFALQQIHRQAEDSEIIKLSMAVRNGNNVAYHLGRDTKRIKSSELSDEEFMSYDQIITGKNINRVELNRKFRRLAGFKNDEPTKRDKLIILRNNPKVEVVNGQQIVVTEANKTKKGKFFINYVDMDNVDSGIKRGIFTSKTFNFADSTSKIKFDRNEYSHDLIMSDFGYAISVHKSQGSGWGKVMLVDDSFGCWDSDLRKRFLYTAITRAIKYFTWVS